MYQDIISEAQASGHIAKEIDPEALALILLALPTGLSVLNLAGAPRVNDASWTAILTRVVSSLKK
jgi:hypothetical protein